MRLPDEAPAPRWRIAGPCACHLQEDSAAVQAVTARAPAPILVQGTMRAVGTAWTEQLGENGLHDPGKNEFRSSRSGN